MWLSRYKSLWAARFAGDHRRQVLKRAVDLSGLELCGVPAKPVLFWHLVGIEGSFPVLVGPARGTDPCPLRQLPPNPDAWRCRAYRVDRTHGASHIHVIPSMI